MQMKEMGQTERGTSLASPVYLLKNIIKTWSLEEEYITLCIIFLILRTSVHAKQRTVAKKGERKKYGRLLKLPIFHTAYKGQLKYEFW